jgi:branched-chain amino acid transport system permease protein
MARGAETKWLETSRGNMTLFETVSISNPRFTAAVTCILVLLALLYLLHAPGPARRCAR